MAGKEGELLSLAAILSDALVVECLDESFVAVAFAIVAAAAAAKMTLDPAQTAAAVGGGERVLMTFDLSDL